MSETLAGTDVMRSGEPAQELNVPLAGVRVLELSVTDGGDGGTDDHADWADAKISC